MSTIETATVILLLRRHTWDLAKCPLNRGCAVNRGHHKSHNICLLQDTTTETMISVTKSHFALLI